MARLVGLPIFDPQGDQVAKVRDLVVAIRTETSQPRVLGMVAEVFGRRRIFVVVLLAVAVLWMGLHPKPLADVMNPTLQELLRHVMQSKVS